LFWIVISIDILLHFGILTEDYQLTENYVCMTSCHGFAIPNQTHFEFTRR